MCKDSEKDCNTCRHNPGCLKKGLAVFLLFIQKRRLYIKVPALSGF